MVTIPKSQRHDTVTAYFFINTICICFFLTVGWLGALATVVAQGLRLMGAPYQHVLPLLLWWGGTKCTDSEFIQGWYMLTSVHILLARESHVPSPNFMWVGKYRLSMSLKRAENRSMYALAPFMTLMESLELGIMGSNVTTPSERPVLSCGCTFWVMDSGSCSVT